MSRIVKVLLLVALLLMAAAPAYADDFYEGKTIYLCFRADARWS